MIAAGSCPQRTTTLRESVPGSGPGSVHSQCVCERLRGALRESASGGYVPQAPDGSSIWNLSATALKKTLSVHVLRLSLVE